MRRPGLLVLTGGCALAACSLGFDGDDLQTGAATTSVTTGGNGGDGGAASAGGSGDENCNNGVDDDNDGLIDCLDDVCSCAALPPGWYGPAALILNGTCPGRTVAAGGIGATIAPDAQCESCGCAPAKDTCGANLFLYSDESCTMYLIDFPAGLSACNNELTGIIPGITVSGQAVPGGSCDPSGGEATVNEVSWRDGTASLCQLEPGAGCEALEFCAGGPTCIYQEGEHNCPADFPDAHSLSSVTSDTRGCSACQCGDPTGTMCAEGTVILYGQDGCVGQVESGQVGQCISSNQGVESATVISMNPGTCEPVEDGAMPIGSVTTLTTTVCCRAD
jgi:hypothetical protein